MEAGFYFTKASKIIESANKIIESENSRISK